MILRKISLRNFRQFYGEQSVVVAPPGARNVTLVHAENGVGKTTLLNAMLWTFFGETTKRFEQREKIVNFAAAAEGAPEARVAVDFEHNGVAYSASRVYRATKGGYKKGDFEVSRIESNGTHSAPLLNPEQFVHSVIPRDMAQYFFFDGEQAETFSSETNYKEVGAAIRDILGCLLLETAQGDLEYLAKAYDKELGELEGEDLIREKETEISALQAKIGVRTKAIADATTNIEALEEQLNKLTESLRRAQESAALQKDRDAKAEMLKTCGEQIGDCEGEIARWIAVKGMAVVSGHLTQQTLDFVNAEELKGRIPSPYNEEFVDNLLKARSCICQRPLEPGGPEWKAVQGLLKHAANAEAMSRLVRVRARVSALREARDDAPHLLEAQQTKLATLLTRRRTLQLELEELGRKLEGLPVAEIQQREASRKATEKRSEDLKLKRMADQTENESDQRSIDRLRGEVDALAVKNELARKLVRRRDVSLVTARKLQEILKHYEKDARTEIQGSVNEILARVARKDYRLEIGENFELRLLFANGQPTPKSGGENQLMSLAFIAALIHFAQRRTEHTGNALFIPATVAPLILDSPFGQLDDSYRAATAAFVPEMAPQVVLLVSSSQGKSEVVDALHGRVGAEYVLIAENQGPKGQKSQDFLNLNGRRLATTLFNCPRDLTRIEKVELS